MDDQCCLRVVLLRTETRVAHSTDVNLRRREGIRTGTTNPAGAANRDHHHRATTATRLLLLLPPVKHGSNPDLHHRMIAARRHLLLRDRAGYRIHRREQVMKTVGIRLLPDLRVKTGEPGPLNLRDARFRLLLFIAARYRTTRGQDLDTIGGRIRGM
jgi:hypothetical protein